MLLIIFETILNNKPTTTMKTTTHYYAPSKFAYSTNYKPKTSAGTILARIWFGGCLAACLGSGAMLLVAWQSVQPSREVAQVETLPIVEKTVERPSLTAAAKLAASLHSSTGSSSETKRNSSVSEESEVASVTAWFDAAQSK